MIPMSYPSLSDETLIERKKKFNHYLVFTPQISFFQIMTFVLCSLYRYFL